MGGESDDGGVEWWRDGGGQLTIQPGGLAPKRMGDVVSGQDGRGKQQRKRGSRRQGGAGGKRQGNSKWSICMTGFSADPGGAVLVAGNYIVEAVQSQVILQGSAGREPELPVVGG